MHHVIGVSIEPHLLLVTQLWIVRADILPQRCFIVRRRLVTRIHLLLLGCVKITRLLGLALQMWGLVTLVLAEIHLRQP